MISVVFISSHKMDLTVRCLDSLARASARAWNEEQPIELILGYQDESRREDLQGLVRQIGFKNCSIEFLDRKSSVPMGRNQLLKLRNLNTTWILFIDDDIQVPLEFFVEFERMQAAWPQARIFGGPNLTPPDQGGLAKDSGFLLGSFLNFVCRNRYQKATEGLRGDSRSFILCNLFVDARLAPEFSAELPFGEELGLIDRYLSQGHSCVYSPNLYVYHFRRETLGALLAQLEKYGLGRGLTWGCKPCGFRVADLRLLMLLTVACVCALPLALVFRFTSDWNSKQSTLANRLSFLSLSPFFYFKGLLKGLLQQSDFSAKDLAAANVQIQ